MGDHTGTGRYLQHHTAVMVVPPPHLNKAHPRQHLDLYAIMGTHTQALRGPITAGKATTATVKVGCFVLWSARQFLYKSVSQLYPNFVMLPSSFFLSFFIYLKAVV